MNIDNTATSIFPPVHSASDDGLIAIGGDLTSSTLIDAYSHGIFPWFNENQPIMWWSPDPRAILFPDELHIGKNMRKMIRRRQFDVTIDSAFEQTIIECSLRRNDPQTGTWITSDMISAYSKLHKLGFAHSVEVWLEGELVGGLYGISIGHVFFGESMFSLEPNSSKYALIVLIGLMKINRIQILDCQMESSHLNSIGARTIPRENFIKFLERDTRPYKSPENWNYCDTLLDYAS